MKKKIGRYSVIVFSSWFIVHATSITIDGLNDHYTKADCAVVLGNKVNNDGSLSPRLQGRLDKSLELYRKEFTSKIIVSGGKNDHGYYEAVEMKNYLVWKGVPHENILVDSAGYNTWATGVNFLPLAKKHTFNSVILVSQFYHITRTKLVFRRLGVRTIYSAHADFYEILYDPYSVFREFVAYYKYWLFNW